MLALRVATSSNWLDCVLADFSAFLIDHAACERKAAATGMSFVVRYPDRVALLEPMIAFAREELEHFHRVYRIIESRRLRLGPDEPDLYLAGLLRQVRTGREPRLLDRLLVAGIVEARGCERFTMIAGAVTDGELRTLYDDIVRAEARHQSLFLRLARNYFPPDEVGERLSRLLDHEAEIVVGLALRPALH